jgi:hypothetical protein
MWIYPYNKLHDRPSFHLTFKAVDENILMPKTIVTFYTATLIYSRIDMMFFK